MSSGFIVDALEHLNEIITEKEKKIQVHLRKSLKMLIEIIDET